MAITVNPRDARKFSMRVRIPVITREWRRGDRIELELPLVPQRVVADPRIAATRGKVALRNFARMNRGQVSAREFPTEKPLDRVYSQVWMAGRGPA